MTQLRWPAVRLRVAVLALAVVATSLVPHPSGAVLVLAGAATIVAVVAPAYVGAVVLVVVDIVGWAAAYGFDASPPVVRTLLFSLALYLLHAVTALAASVPAVADVESGVVTAWLVRCVPGAVAAALAGALVGVLGRLHGSVALDIVGMAAVVTVLGVLVWASRSVDSRESSQVRNARRVDGGVVHR